jgi:hypothetical protein
MPRRTPPNLAVVAPQSNVEGLPPPKGLDESGTRLWHDVTSNYEFSDAASLVILEQSCRALDRAERCAAEISATGELIRVGKALRANPLLRDELGFRAFAVRSLSKLGLDLEPVRGIGRPPGPGVGMKF